jgi:hypothetical protein
MEIETEGKEMVHAENKSQRMHFANYFVSNYVTFVLSKQCSTRNLMKLAKQVKNKMIFLKKLDSRNLKLTNGA